MLPISKLLKLVAFVALLTTSLIAQAAVSNSEFVSAKSNDGDLQKEISRLLDERSALDSFGVVLANIHDFSPEVVSAAKKELRFNDRLQILSVRKGSIADKLGLKPGDQLLQINSYYVERGKEALESFNRRVIPGIDWDGTIDTVVIRDGYGQSHHLDPDSQ